ncbi:MAG: M28 family peptidase [bacterium]|nr:M28 family peptidase [bacterium]
MKYFLLITIGLFYFILNSNAQDTSYARKVLNELCSPKYAGRGYVEHGDKKAAAYIQNQFKSIGLKKVEGTYQQKFTFPVNTFPGKVIVKYNGQLLVAGRDYIINAGCKSYRYKGSINFSSIDNLKDSSFYDRIGYNQKMAVIDTFNTKYFGEAVLTNKKYLTDFKKELIVKLTNDKMTWTSAYEQDNKCIITLKSNVFDRNKPAEFDIEIESEFYGGYSEQGQLYGTYTSQNVLGMLEGTENRDSFIVFTAHYDHLGMMGSTAMFPGANDNASGIAMLLNLAKYFKAHPQKYNLLFIAFSGEETGLIGSQFYVKHPIIPLEKIHFLINIDLMGNGAEGVMAVNGATFKEQFNLLTKINTKNNYLPTVKARGRAQNSDHFYFSEAGVPCFFFYLMGPYPYYHDIDDKASAVPFTNFSNAFLLFRDFIIGLQP